MSTLKTAYQHIVGNALVAILTALLLLMGTQIVLRYFFSSSLIWAEEICRYLLIWASFLAVTLAYERGEIASVTILRDALSRTGGLLLSILANLAGIALLVTLVYYGLVYAQRLGSPPIPGLQFLIGDVMGPGWAAPSMFWVYISLPFGLAIFAVRLAVDIVHYVGLILSGGHAGDLRAIHDQGDIR
ncbi:TRAP transporter small permease [Mesorhizobium sp. CAU 1741]|uniref:TRAP transporter small permease n=1 Tax=Mesorhizobium sp. CAU 1741 TaxID=3140366 RepID=UPI00325ADB17